LKVTGLTESLYLTYMNSKSFMGFLILGCCLNAFPANAQFRSKLKSYNFYTLTTKVNRMDPEALMLANKTPGRYSAPMFTASAGNHHSTYFLSQMTTQTMKDGKMGTYYLWDQQGNLRESRFFLDIGGKSKPGLKLVFPRR
jgi:hypothetical protein